MKRLALILAFLLLACNVFAGQTVRPIIASGTIAAGELRISAVNGTAFLDLASDATASANFVAAVANNDVIEISDSSKRKIIAYAKAQGTGETLGDELFSNYDFSGAWGANDTPDGWTLVGTPDGDDYLTKDDANNKLTFTVSGNQVFSISQTYAPYNTHPLIKNVTVVDSVTSGKIKVQMFSYAIREFTAAGTFATYGTGYNDQLVYLGRVSGSAGVVTIKSSSFKQVLTPSNLGITLTNSPGGTTYNFGVKDSAFNYNDTLGYTYRILSSTAYSKLIATQSPVSGTLHIATVDGGAMFFHDSIDFSSYAGNDTDSTPYLFVFYDSTGKSAQAYAGAVGGGEALGDEKHQDTGFADESKWNLTAGNWSIAGGALLAGSATNQSVYQLNAGLVTSLVTGELYKSVFDITAYTSGGFASRLTGQVSGVTRTGTGTFTDYLTADSSATGAGIIGLTSATGSCDNKSLKKLTDVPATGLHLISSKNGSTRNMKSVESGFNANAITRLNIYRAL